MILITHATIDLLCGDDLTGRERDHRHADHPDDQ